MRKNNIRATDSFCHLPSQLLSISCLYGWVNSCRRGTKRSVENNTLKMSLSHTVLLQVDDVDTITNIQMICIKLKGISTCIVCVCARVRVYVFVCERVLFL